MKHYQKEFDNSLDSFFECLRGAKNSLDIADMEVLSLDRRRKDHANRTKSYVMVNIASCLEALVKNYLYYLLLELNCLSLEAKRAKPPLVSVAYNNEFMSLRDSRGDKHWYKRIAAVSAVDSDEVLRFPEDAIPIDGKTIRKRHFQLIWDVFGLPGYPLPKPVYEFTLREIADDRNDIAHGNDLPGTIGRRKSIEQVRRYINHIFDIVDNFTDAVEDFFEYELYLR